MNNSMTKKELWLRLKNYSFDHIVQAGLRDRVKARFGKTAPSLQALAGKIARKNGWKNTFALRVLEEYKKFIYLGLVSDFFVTPSKVIDIAWHEHILFSKAYRDFCEDIIGQPFDHYPELIAAEEATSVYSAQYLATLELYQKEFGLRPPAGIWDVPKFDKELLAQTGHAAARKKKAGPGDLSFAYDSSPLHSYFEEEPASTYPEFSGYGEGDFGGGGAAAGWSDGAGESGSDGGGCSGGCGGGGD